MEDEINFHLTLSSIDEKYLEKFNNLLIKYEYSCYENDQVPDKIKLKNWVSAIKEKIIKKKSNKKTPNLKNFEDKKMVDVLSLLISQVEDADKNISIFDTSSVKLKSLSLNSKALNKEFEEKQRISKKFKENEIREIRNIYFGLTIFFIVICYIFLMRIGKFGLFFAKKFVKIFNFLFGSVESETFGRNEL